MKRPWWLEVGVGLQGTKAAAAVELGAGRTQTVAVILIRILSLNEAEVMDEEDRDSHWLRKKILKTRKARC